MTLEFPSVRMNRREILASRSGCRSPRGAGVTLAIHRSPTSDHQAACGCPDQILHSYASASFFVNFRRAIWIVIMSMSRKPDTVGEPSKVLPTVSLFELFCGLLLR